ETLHRTVVSGCPVLAIVARKSVVSPSSTLPPLGLMLSCKSLVTVTAALSDSVLSAWLVAVTVTVAGDGRSFGAVYAPVVVIVPTAALRPGTPFTLQLTAVLAVLLTVALNLVVFPSTTELLFGVTATATEPGTGGGGGTGVTAPPPPLPHPLAQTRELQT